MEYYIQIFLMRNGKRTIAQGSVLSGPNIEAAVNEWLDSYHEPRLFKWKFAAQVGSNAPRHGGVLNGLIFDSIKEMGKSLSLHVFALVPIDPVADRLI